MCVLVYFSWAKDHRQVYLLGNPFVWWLSTASVGVYVLLKILLILRRKRGYTEDMNNRTFQSSIVFPSFVPKQSVSSKQPSSTNTTGLEPTSV